MKYQTETVTFLSNVHVSNKVEIEEKLTKISLKIKIALQNSIQSIGEATSLGLKL